MYALHALILCKDTRHPGKVGFYYSIMLSWCQSVS